MEEGNSRFKPFPTTQWSLIVRAAADDPVDRERALSEICTLYWPPVYAFIRSKGHAPHDAEDLTQGFFAELLERNDFARADAAHGRLRSYLLIAAKNHLSSHHRNTHRLKRGGGAVLLSLDTASAEERCLIPEAIDTETPDRVFERQWAITVMETVLLALKERYEKKGQLELFLALRPYVMVTTSPDSVSAVAKTLGMTDAAVRVATHRLKQRYAELFRETVRSTLGRDEDLEEEVRWLMAAFDRCP